MRYLGIDPGLSGAAAVIEAAPSGFQLLDVIDIPTTGEKAKRRVDVIALYSWIKLTVLHAGHGVIERAQAMPDQGASSGFVYGRAVGAIEACVTLAGVPLEIIESSAWKKFHGLIRKGKEDARQRAIMLFPSDGSYNKLARKMDHNRAEAILMARYAASLVALRPASGVSVAISGHALATADPNQIDLAEVIAER